MSMFRRAGKGKREGPHRANTGSSIRGKISAPIIADESSLQEPGAGTAIPAEQDSMERQFPMRSSTGSVQLLNANRVASSVVGDSPRASTPPQPVYDPPPPPPTTKLSAPATSTTTIYAGTGNGTPQRKKSSLGSVFRKLFGGKKRKDSSSSSIMTAQGPGGSKAGQHRSDPTALNRSWQDQSLVQKRSASLPINEFNRALRSHSIFLEDFPIEDDTNRDPKQSDGQTRPRRATTPSRLWVPNKTIRYTDWTGLSPRPASTHGRESKFISDAEAGAAALTSGSHPNRRSRSLGELRGLGHANITIRRRSDEIRYWRESYDPGLLSPMSSKAADAEDPSPSELPEMPQEVSQEQPQPFNFGLMSEMAGMKITQAASLETRVQRLEERMLQMEKAISEVHQNTKTEPVQFEATPKRTSRREGSVSTNRPSIEYSDITLPSHLRDTDSRPPAGGLRGSQKRSTSYGSRRPSTTSTQNSYHPSSESFSRPFIISDEQTFVNTSQVTRPLSTSTTIRGIPSSSSVMAKDANLTGEHYTVLMNLILAEQAARQNLEAVVESLQQQLQELRSGAAASFAAHGSHLQSDPLIAGDDNEFSSFEHGDSSDDEDRYLRDDFRTPDEERGKFSDNIFGDTHVRDTKGSPRTLSLSRMTLGMSPKVNL